jgi:HEAT repeat protein
VLLKTLFGRLKSVFIRRSDADSDVSENEEKEDKEEKDHDEDAGSGSPTAMEELIASLKAQPPEVRRGANVSLTDLGVSDAFLPPLLAATTDKDPYIRAGAVYAFAEYSWVRHPQTIQAVLRALASDPDASVRGAAAHVLEKWRWPAHVPPLVTALGDESAEVRWEAVWALGNIRTEEAVAAIRGRLLDDEDARVRALAARELADVLRQRADATVVSVLLRAANDGDDNVRAEALSALHEATRWDSGESDDSTGDDDQTRDLFKRSPQLFELFTAGLSDASPVVRERAANVLCFSSPKASAALLAALGDESPGVRREAVRALGSLTALDAIDQLAERLFDDPDEDVRSSAADALGEMQDERSTRHLMQAYSRQGGDVGCSVLDALGENNDFQAVPVLCSALKHPNSEFRESAARSLGQLPWGREVSGPDTTEALRGLCAALDDGEPSVRKGVCEALGRLGDVRAIDSLIKALHDDDDDVRAEAVDAIGEIDAKGNVSLFIGCLKDPSPDVQRQAAKHICLAEGAVTSPELRAYLLDPEADPLAKGYLAKSLTRHRDPAMVPILVEALACDDETTRRAVVETLQELPDPRAMKPLLGLLADDDDGVRGQAALALAAIGDDKAIKPLRRLLRRDPSPFVRRRAVWALSYFNPEKTVPLLTEAFDDSDPHVRNQAVKGLAEICDAEELRFLLSELPDEYEDVKEALEQAADGIEGREAPDRSSRARPVHLGTLHYE